MHDGECHYKCRVYCIIAFDNKYIIKEMPVSMIFTIIIIIVFPRNTAFSNAKLVCKTHILVALTGNWSDTIIVCHPTMATLSLRKFVEF